MNKRATHIPLTSFRLLFFVTLLAATLALLLAAAILLYYFPPGDWQMGFFLSVSFFGLFLYQGTRRWHHVWVSIFATRRGKTK